MSCKLVMVCKLHNVCELKNADVNLKPLSQGNKLFSESGVGGRGGRELAFVLSPVNH